IGLPVISGEVAGMRIEAPVALSAISIPFGRPGRRPVAGSNRRVGAGWRSGIGRGRKRSADGGTNAESDQAGAPIAWAAPAPAAMPVAIPTVAAPAVAAPTMAAP